MSLAYAMLLLSALVGGLFVVRPLRRAVLSAPIFAAYLSSRRMRWVMKWRDC